MPPTDLKLLDDQILAENSGYSDEEEYYDDDYCDCEDCVAEREENGW